MNCFSTLEEKFRVSARPCNILYLFLEKIKDSTRSDLKISRTSAGTFREIAETSRIVTNLRVKSPKLLHNFIAIFHRANFLGSQQSNRLIPQLRVSSDLTGHTGESVQTPGKPK